MADPSKPGSSFLVWYNVNDAPEYGPALPELRAVVDELSRLYRSQPKGPCTPLVGSPGEGYRAGSSSSESGGDEEEEGGGQEDKRAEDVAIRIPIDRKFAEQVRDTVRKRDPHPNPKFLTPIPEHQPLDNSP